jgi:hypothetical protein
MPHLTAVVVGDCYTVGLEAAKRGIPAAFVRETGMEACGSKTPARIQTVIRVGSQHLGAVAHWLSETNSRDILPGIGFPVGSLLLYSHHGTE